MIYDIIVVGGGPAGMTAALYGARAGKSVCLMEGEMSGGQILQSQKIENYPALPNTDGYTFAENLKAQVLDAGVVSENVHADSVESQNGEFCITADGRPYWGRTVILATGLRHRRLEVPGEEERIGRGVSFCATCDGMFFRKRAVAVVGGGNTAVQDALVLSDFCSHVYLIHRRMQLRAEQMLTDRMMKKENVTFLGDSVVEEILGEGRVESLRLKNVKTGETSVLEVAGVFEAVGYLPQNAAFASLVPLDEDGYLITDETCATSVPGIFAAGDGRQKAIRQLTTATADGTVAALSAVDYLNGLRK